MWVVLNCQRNVLRTFSVYITLSPLLPQVIKGKSLSLRQYRSANKDFTERQDMLQKSWRDQVN